MKTVNLRYEKTLEVMKSKFFAILMPLSNVDEFKALLASVQKEHKKAKHVVYAYRVDEVTKSCDDQEPHGTAGRPLLELIHKRELNHVVIFVARYFGGVKLGAGKLLRTYLQSGIDVVNIAELIDL